MPDPRGQEHATDLVVIGFGLALLLLFTPLRELWARDHAPWWAPFAIWSGLVVLSAWLIRQWTRHGD